jgi:hypothetical protein
MSVAWICPRVSWSQVTPHCLILHADLGQDIALACGLPHVAGWVEWSSGSRANTSTERAASSSSDATAGMHPSTPSLAGSSLPARREGKAGTRACIADAAAESRAEPKQTTSTAHQYLSYLEWLQREVLEVLDEVQRAAGRG